MVDILTGKDLFIIIQNSHKSAFTEFYTVFFQKLLLTSDKYVNNVYVAEEIVQNVFLKIWESPESLEEIKSIKPYLYTAVINASLSHINRQKNIEQHHLKIAADLTEEQLLDLDEENDLVVLLHHEIEKLPAQCKKIFKLNRFDRLKYREIAHQLNLSERTVENHISHALKVLRLAMLSHPKVIKKEKNYKMLLAVYLF